MISIVSGRGGGFPDSLLAQSDGASLDWRRAFVRSYLERDVPMFAPRMPAETIGRLWTMLAHSQASPLDQSRLASSLEVSAPAVTRYIDLLVDLLLVRRLRPWIGNTGKRLVRTPKVYIRDSGLTHALLDLETWDQVLGHPVAGASWEGFVSGNLIAVAGDRRTPYFYQTEDGAEIDLLFERDGLIEMVIEIKRSTAPTLSRGFNSARQALQPREAYLVRGGTESWPMADGVTAIGLRELMRKLADHCGRVRTASRQDAMHTIAPRHRSQRAQRCQDATYREESGPGRAGRQKRRHRVTPWPRSACAIASMRHWRYRDRT